ncbi:hypothetical protein EPR50_G00072110 [Perca flavescens]|uniref:SOWAHA-C winged helix-turn-helix domain-containing protein n=1 Tax=Perca flavescens TaxID=8167 RepID=A0A484D4E2_PERFV|nr:hypothetical protein EPR50_G00072110 [Perca flavescens]
MGDVSEESLLDYFYSTGGSSGRVKNADLLKTFKPFIGHSDLQFRAKYREEFKLIIDRIAVVKSENGEKYLVLKKKYRQMLHERDPKHHGTDADGQSGSSPARAPATVQWDATDALASSHPQQDEQMSCGGPDGAAEDQQTGTAFMQPTLLQLPVIQTQGPSAQSNGDDELDKDSGSKSESEQDEESTGSMGSAAVALDPIEKEWIYSAAGARVPDLSQLLRQDPSLANKKDFTSVGGLGRGHPSGQEQKRRKGRRSILFGLVHHSRTPGDPPSRLSNSPLANLSQDATGGQTKDTEILDQTASISICLPDARHPGGVATYRSLSPFSGHKRTVFSLSPAVGQARSATTALHWAAKHGNKDMASLVANAGADVNTKSHVSTQGYTPLHIAALHGHRHILDLLLVTYGAKDNLRDYSGHLARHYLNIKEPEGPEEDCELHFQVTQARERNRNRKLVSLFHSKKKWGSAEELAPIEEERTASHQLILPAFRPRKFSR